MAQRKSGREIIIAIMVFMIGIFWINRKTQIQDKKLNGSKSNQYGNNSIHDLSRNLVIFLHKMMIEQVLVATAYTPATEITNKLKGPPGPNKAPILKVGLNGKSTSSLKIIIVNCYMVH